MNRRRERNTRKRSKSRSSRSRSPRTNLTRSELESSTIHRDGGFDSLDGKSLKELQPTVEKSFEVLSKNNQDFNLKFVRIRSGKKQIVSGIRYKLFVECTDPEEKVKICHVDIWEQAWENFVQVRIMYRETKFYSLYL